jgi:regulatory protein
MFNCQPMNENPSQSNYRQAVAKVSEICSKSEKSRAEVIRKLKEWELTAEEISKAVDFLVSEKYIDDQRFAGSFVRDKFRLNKWGKIKIGYMLRQKGIDDNIVSDALDDIPNEDYRETLAGLLKAKVRSVKGKSNYEKVSKLAAFAQSHGFEAGSAIEISRELLGNVEDVS